MKKTKKKFLEVCRLSSLAADNGGTAVTEFVIVAPLFLTIFIGILEISLQFFYAASVEKAAQLGVRIAVVTTPGAAVPATNAKTQSANFGDPCSPTSDPCTGFAAVTCTGATCAGGFPIILARMQTILPSIQAQNVTLRYEYAAIGFAGGPAAPTVTLTITGLNWPAGPFAAVRTLLGGTATSTTLPVIRATLTGEDMTT